MACWSEVCGSAEEVGKDCVSGIVVVEEVGTAKGEGISVSISAGWSVVVVVEEVGSAKGEGISVSISAGWLVVVVAGEGRHSVSILNARKAVSPC